MDRNQRPVYTISVVAGFVAVHPRTLRLWDALGLVTPARQSHFRRYSEADLERLRLVHYLSSVARVNIAGVGLLLQLYDLGRFRLEEIFPDYPGPED
jgi:MerR family transcriptional regulator/heat shock protein HspR